MKFFLNRFSRRGVVLPVMLLLLAGSQAFASGKSLKYKVTITNITKGQILSPAVVASHRPGFEPLFVLGETASMELAGVAEDADLMPLVNSLDADPKVIDVGILGNPDNVPPIIKPGESASIMLKAGYGFTKTQISLVGMLVTTNDAFYGLNAASVDAPAYYRNYGKKEMFLVPAYDSGTEFNSESCAFIPGPPCGTHAHDDSDAEGFVHIHNGIHGEGDLDPDEFDWKNPVAKITIQLVK